MAEEPKKVRKRAVKKSASKAVEQSESAPAAKEKKSKAKQMAQIRVYREVIEFSGRASELGTLGVNKATVGRSDPVEMTVQREAVLDERDVKRATLVEQRDQSFSIAVEFVQRGSAPSAWLRFSFSVPNPSPASFLLGWRHELPSTGSRQPD